MVEPDVVRKFLACAKLRLRRLADRLREFLARLVPPAGSRNDSVPTSHLHLAHCVHYEHCVAVWIIVALGTSERHARHVFTSKADAFLHPEMRVCLLADAGSPEELGMMAALIPELAQQQVARQSAAHASFYGEFIVYSR